MEFKATYQKYLEPTLYKTF